MLDGYAAAHEAGGELQEEEILPAELTAKTSQYGNNMSAQDHRRVKQRVRPMLGFQRFASAAVTLANRALVHLSKKKRLNLSTLCPAHTCLLQGWQAVLAA